MKSRVRLLIALLAHCVLASSLTRAMDVNVTLTPGYNLVANPLTATDNSIGNLFKNMQGGVPPGTKVFKFVVGAYISATWDDLDNQFIPTSAAAEITLPGDGVFVFIPGSESKVLTFTGEVRPPTSCLMIPQGFSIRSPLAPGGGIWFAPPDIRINPLFVNRIFRFNKTTQAYDTYTFDDLDNTWMPLGLPQLQVGEAVFIFNSGSAITWCPVPPPIIPIPFGNDLP